MSLDIWLTLESATKKAGSGIFVRENGETKEISRAEWNEKFPGREPIVVDAEEEGDKVYWANITHNLGRMAGEAGIYKCLWRPGENGFERARQLIEPLEAALQDMKSRPAHYSQFDAANGWGTYKGFVPWLENLLAACAEYPEAKISVSV
ncbi:MAG: hypothetical protein KDA89_25275 [Planctomycetaceae bacterium]|nr:hypothetical protein [Planctomycetaceae bacterium]